MLDDPGDYLCPKRCDLWKPVVAAVNGMACGGAFYLLGEADIIVASDAATFFDPHVTYGMPAVFEPIHMAQKMPFGEIMRMSLLGSYERMSADRAREIGLVSEVVAPDRLEQAAGWVAGIIASQPEAAVQATVRAVWATREMTRSAGLTMAFSLVGQGTTSEALAAGQAAFSSGQRVDWKLR
jgi:enoyl-CoA hydratase/carnithine racemase